MSGYRTITFPSRRGFSSFVVRCYDADYFSFWDGFVKEYAAFSGIDAMYARKFLSEVFSKRPMGMFRRWGDRFLLEPESFWEWIMFWKEMYQASPSNYMRRCMYRAIYAVRYRLHLYPDGSHLGAALESMVMGKELSTFILDSYTGKGSVGFCQTSDGNRTVAMEFHFRNKFLERVYLGYFESSIGTNRVSEFSFCHRLFEESLGEFSPGISSYSDFSEVTLFFQADYFRKLLVGEKNACQLIHKANRHIVGFYRYLLGFQECCDTFAMGTLSPVIVKNNNFTAWLYAGMEYVAFNDIAVDECRPKAMVVLKDLYRLGTRFVNGEGVIVDLTFILEPSLRNIVWRYIRTHLEFLLGGNRIRMVADAVSSLEKLSFINMDDSKVVLTAKTAMSIRAGILAKEISDETVALIFVELKKFFEWAFRDGLIVLESPFVLRAFQYRLKYTGSSQRHDAAPLKHAKMLRSYFAEKAQGDYRWRLMNLMLELLCGSRFRPNMICTMRVSRIRLIGEGDFCFIYSVTKVSGGDLTESPVSMNVYNMLSEVINESAEMRERCPDDDIRDCVFLYEGCNGFVRLRENNLRSSLAFACKELGIPVYSPYSFRRTFATVWDELDRKLGHHGDLAAQAMGHRKYKTTLDHYIDRSFEEFRRVGDAARVSSDEMMRLEYEALLKG